MDRHAPDRGRHRRHRTPRLFHDRRRLRVGLFGGSFNPAHDGHLHLSDLAQRQLRLDEVWWLVSPQNPLKNETGMASLATRLAAARQVEMVYTVHNHNRNTRLVWKTRGKKKMELRPRAGDVVFVLPNRTEHKVTSMRGGGGTRAILKFIAHPRGARKLKRFAEEKKEAFL